MTALQPPYSPPRSRRARLTSSTPPPPRLAEPIAPAAPPSFPLPSPSSTASGIDSLGPPLAFQDMGRNKPKLYYFASADSALLHTQEEVRSDQQLVVDHFFTSPSARRLVSLWPLRSLLQHMLPTNYPASVSRFYPPFTKWSVLGGVASTAANVLSLQCLLYGVGLGQELAVPAAAAISWVLKDGIGQLGGIFFAAYVSNSFDSDAKRWRMLAALALDAAVVVEILTPLTPNHFLLLASLANIGKYVAWLSSSAARAAISSSFCREQNLADVTAKGNSQMIGASLIGTALAVAVSWLVGAQPLYILAVFAVLSAVHLSSTYVSLCHVPLNTLNEQRGQRVMMQFVSQGTVPTTEAVRDRENFLRRYRSPLARHTRLDADARLTTLLQHFADMMTAPSTTPASSAASSHPAHSAASSPLEAMLGFFDGQPYLLTVSPTHAAASYVPRYVISLAFLSTATPSDVLTAHLLSLHYRMAIDSLLSSPSPPPTLADLTELLRDSVRWVRQHRATFLQLVSDSGWNVEHLFVEADRQRRITILQAERGGARKEQHSREGITSPSSLPQPSEQVR